MRKMTMNRLAALAVALMMAALVPMGALAEDINITTPTDLAPVVTEELIETENASNVTEQETETVVEEVEEVIEEPVEEIVEEIIEEPVEEIVEETAEETSEEIIEEPVEESAEEIVEEIVEEPAEDTVEEIIEEAAPQGTVRILLLNEGPLYYGDEVSLLADVDNIEDEHTLTWQIKVDIDKWENIAVGRNYRFILTPENASLEYRVIVNVAE